MEAKTCEEYVLNELAGYLLENEKLKAELETANARLEAIESVKPSPIEQLVVKAGRRALFNDKTYARSTDVMDGGEPKPFGTWCMEAMDVYRFPKSIDKSDFMAFFEPEFREAYQEKLEEEKCSE